jgi:predicted GTPase
MTTPTLLDFQSDVIRRMAAIELAPNDVFPTQGILSMGKGYGKTVVSAFLVQLMKSMKTRGIYSRDDTTPPTNYL